uniref:Uncharacterized protein n=1 Tax=Knipowitschia caucasica TaxID=637954 RepID=A0AAV2LWS5_KNICA
MEQSAPLLPSADQLSTPELFLAFYFQSPPQVFSESQPDAICQCVIGLPPGITPTFSPRTAKAGLKPLFQCFEENQRKLQLLPAGQRRNVAIRSNGGLWLGGGGNDALKWCGILTWLRGILTSIH